VVSKTRAEPSRLAVERRLPSGANATAFTGTEKRARVRTRRFDGPCEGRHSPCAVSAQAHIRADRVRGSDSNDRLEQRREIMQLCGFTDVLIKTALDQHPWKPA
jgi:hypothetical protein